MEKLPLFRAPKRRKMIRSQQGNDEPGVAQQREARASDVLTDASDEEDVANLVQAQKTFRKARPGITFSTNAPLNAEQTELGALVPTDTPSERLRGIADRFVGSGSGQVVDVDKHMVAFIDSEMAKRRQANTLTLSQTNNSTSSTLVGQPHSITQDNHSTQPQQHQLSEVDLSSLPVPSRKPSTGPPRRLPRKPRLGRDGKPLRPRPRKRRNSEDIARDALVEQVLHEHKLGSVYQPPNSDRDLETHSDGEQQVLNADRDEVFAERFRQDFLDQVAERRQAQQQKKSTTNSRPAEKTQGPKLGGSRSARAKMAAMQQQQQGAGAGQT